MMAAGNASIGASIEALNSCAPGSASTTAAVTLTQSTTQSSGRFTPEQLSIAATAIKLVNERQLGDRGESRHPRSRLPRVRDPEPELRGPRLGRLVAAAGGLGDRRAAHDPGLCGQEVLRRTG